MNSNDVPFERLVLPPNEIGWSDESFDLALRYIMKNTNLAEVSDMYLWLRESIAKDIWWGVSRQVVGMSIFKRPMLLSFRNFEPSAMQDAYNEIKQHPRPHLRRRNILYTVNNIFFMVFGIVLAVIVVASILS